MSNPSHHNMNITRYICFFRGGPEQEDSFFSSLQTPRSRKNSLKSVIPSIKIFDEAILMAPPPPPPPPARDETTIYKNNKVHFLPEIVVCFSRVIISRKQNKQETVEYETETLDNWCNRLIQSSDYKTVSVDNYTYVVVNDIFVDICRIKTKIEQYMTDIIGYLKHSNNRDTFVNLEKIFRLDDIMFSVKLNIEIVNRYLLVSK